MREAWGRWQPHIITLGQTSQSTGLITTEQLSLSLQHLLAHWPNLCPPGNLHVLLKATPPLSQSITPSPSGLIHSTPITAAINNSNNNINVFPWSLIKSLIIWWHYITLLYKHQPCWSCDKFYCDRKKKKKRVVVVPWLWASKVSLKPLSSLEASETKWTKRWLSVVWRRDGGLEPQRRSPSCGDESSGPFLSCGDSRGLIITDTLAEWDWSSH